MTEGAGDGDKEGRRHPDIEGEVRVGVGVRVGQWVRRWGSGSAREYEVGPQGMMMQRIVVILILGEAVGKRAGRKRIFVIGQEIW